MGSLGAVSRRAFVAGALGAAGAVTLLGRTAWAQTQSARPPGLAEIFSRPRIGSASLSPQGGRVALLGETAPQSGARPQAFVDVFDTARLSAAPHRIHLTDLEARSLSWASEDRLLIWVKAELPAKAGGDGADLYSRVLAMSPDGSNQVVLFEDRIKSVPASLNLTEILDVLPDEPDHVLMSAWDARLRLPAIYRVNVRDGQAVLTERGAAGTVSWRCQAGSPLLRYDGDEEGRMVSLMARAPGDQRWRLVRRIHRDDNKDFQIVGLTAKPGVVVVKALTAADDVAKVRTLDTRTMTLGKVLSSRRGRDVAKILNDVRGGFLAAAYDDDRRAYDFADPVLAKRYKALNRLFRDECNIELMALDESRARWLAHVSGPREPGAFVYYDAVSGRADRLGSVRPALTADRLAPMEALDVRTRDRATIRAYLTRPLVAGPGPLPLVVMPHGGPEIRDRYDYDPWAQALAAQGWLVLQPNFRGSGGYGRAFAEAGWKRWGERMQQDVEDTVDLLVARGRADPERLAIFGASYGGYAAMMGAVRRPRFYKAVVSAAGPSDLPEMLRFQRDQQKGDATVYDFWRSRMGDPVADAEALRRASPRLRATEIEAPVLLMHGVRDDVVPVAQSRTMAAALKDAGRTVETYEMVGAGHANWGLPAEQAAMQRVIAFLRPHLA